MVGRLKENKCSVSFYAQDIRAGFQVADVILQKSVNTVIPRLTKIILSGITFVSRNLR